MEVRIGVTYSPREIEVDLGESAQHDSVVKDIEAVLAETDKVLWLTDRKGRTVGVPSSKVAYIEIAPHEERRVGFAGT